MRHTWPASPPSLASQHPCQVLQRPSSCRSACFHRASTSHRARAESLSLDNSAAYQLCDLGTSPVLICEVGAVVVYPSWDQCEA